MNNPRDLTMLSSHFKSLPSWDSQVSVESQRYDPSRIGRIDSGEMYAVKIMDVRNSSDAPQPQIWKEMGTILGSFSFRKW